MSDRLTSICAFIIAWTLISGAAWLVLSGVVSFVRLDWSACTDTHLGRAIFAGACVWIAGIMLRDDRP